MMSVLQIILSGVVLLTGAFISSAYCVKHISRGEETVLALLAWAFWPVVLPTMVILRGYSHGIPVLMRKIREAFNNRKRKSSDNEIFPGVEKPSRILQQMLAARILQNPEGLSTFQDRWTSGNLELHWSSNRKYLLICGDNELEVGPSKELDRVINEAAALNYERAIAEKLARTENTALSIIEEMI